LEGAVVLEIIVLITNDSLADDSVDLDEEVDVVVLESVV
jgi:hypothetical protein